MHTATQVYKSPRVSVLQIFFAAYCGTSGRVPNCNGCPTNERIPGTSDTACTHPQHPENKQAYRELAAKR